MAKIKSQYYPTKEESSTRIGKDQPRIPSWEHQKSRGRSGVLICPRCRAVYFDKHWHASDFFYQAYRFHGEVKKTLCPEDKWILAGRGEVDYEGEVIINNIPPTIKQELLQEIRHIGKRAALRDPEDKIIKIFEKGKTLRVLTTENQLALSIAKQVSHSHKGGDLQIKWSEQDKPARIVLEMKAGQKTKKF